MPQRTAVAHCSHGTRRQINIQSHIGYIRTLADILTKREKHIQTPIPTALRSHSANHIIFAALVVIRLRAVCIQYNISI